MTAKYYYHASLEHARPRASASKISTYASATLCCLFMLWIIGTMPSFSDSIRLSTVTCVLSGLAALGSAGPTAASANAQIAAAAAAQAWVPDGYYVPPYYPAPYGGWVDDWRESYTKAKALVDSMTLAEKTNITAGTGIYMGECWLRQDERQLQTVNERVLVC